MARLTLILGVLAMVVYLLDGFRFMLNEWRNWRNKGKWLAVVVTIFLGSATQAEAITCTTTTADLQQATVQSAINAATAGDVICLPSGTQTWTTVSSSTASVIVNKAITLIGTTSCTGTPVTCVDGTIINDGTDAAGGENPMTITGDNSRVSGISFKDPRALSDNRYAVEIACDLCRFDHNSVTQTNSVTVTHGIWIYSYSTKTQLIDHNYFGTLNGASDVTGSHASDIVANGSTSWDQSMTMGDAYATYMEDNNFQFTSVSDGAYDSYAGARLVFRYNTVSETNLGGHGFDSGGFRSVLRQEVYRNTVENTGTALSTWFGIRGGTAYVWQNTILSTAGSYSVHMEIRNYRSDGTACNVCSFPLCDGTYVADQNTSGEEGYACRDQIGRGPSTDPTNDWPNDVISPTFSQPLFPSYSWDNTFKGAAPTISNVSILSGGSGNDHVRIQTFHVLNNREFYMEVPGFDGTVGTGTGTTLPGTCTTGVAYFKTDEGSWNVSGNGDGSGLLYICTATNTWTLSYTPYTYPHPLQGVTAPSYIAIARILRVMEVVLPIVGLGFHFRKYVLACCVATIACTSTISLSTWTASKTLTKQVAVSSLLAVNHFTKPKD